ncbi:DUF1501 domain-containing protein [Luminiphilus sp.]|nr:DUF1501 domain-containing protein [Luminiphilus sp.]
MIDHYGKRSGKLLSRRGVLRGAIAGVSTIAGSSAMKLWGSEQDDAYEGPLLVTLQLDGGVDVTQLCDPKVNVRGEPKINHWADAADPGQAGNILFAPIADNAQLFQEFGSDMLVINGVDAQTNSHETGRLFNWTGSNAEGRPSLSALFAAAQSPNQPLAYSVFGGTSRTAGLVGYNQFSNLSAARTLVQPYLQSWSGHPWRSTADIARAHSMVQTDISRLLAEPNLSVRQRQSLLGYTEARASRDSLQRLAELIPDEADVMRGEDVNVGGQNFRLNLREQMQSALLVFKSGLGSAADLALGGFDSHEQHDAVSEALLTHFADAIRFFWDYAETLGIAERIVLMVGSDFGRTNYYNEGDGKDHWPISSYLIMERDAPWGNRVVGLTDELHFSSPINQDTLKADRNGVVMTPTHVHKALWEYLGLETFAADRGLTLPDAERLPLFDPFVSSVT